MFQCMSCQGCSCGSVKSKHFECYDIHPPQEVQCVHMYSVAWDALGICTNHYLTAGGEGEWLRGGSCEEL